MSALVLGHFDQPRSRANRLARATPTRRVFSESAPPAAANTNLEEAAVCRDAVANIADNDVARDEVFRKDVTALPVTDDMAVAQNKRIICTCYEARPRGWLGRAIGSLASKTSMNETH